MKKYERLKPLTHYIADNDKQKNSIVIWRELSEDEYESLIKKTSVLSAFRDCYSVKAMFLESKDDIANYFNILSNEVIPPDDFVVAPCLITANKLLMNYLSLLKIFIDVVSNNISKVNKEELPTFQKYDSKLYDDLFGYRFLKRLRNYAIHREMPLKHIEVSSRSGTKITCEKSTLLEFDRWSTVRNEIIALTDSIDILPYVEDSKEAVLKLYVKALEIIKYDIYALKMYVEKLSNNVKIECPIIIKTGNTIHELEVNTFPVYYLNLFYSELKLYSMYRENDSQ